MKPDTATLQRLDHLFPPLAHLAPALRNRIAGECTLIRMPAGTRLFDERAPCSGFPLVIEGTVRVAKLAPNGREILLYRVEAGQCCVLSTGCLLGREDYTATGTAQSDVALVLLPRALFDDLVVQDGGFRRLVFGLFSERLAELTLLVEEVAFRRLDQRLAAWLVVHGPDVHLKHQALADELGSVREIISRLLGSFADRGLVELGRSHIRVLDAAGLRRIAEAA
jgi:CRP/FNR family transcriptional regulator